MWMLYILASALTAGVVIKILLALAGKGRHRHGETVTASDRRLGNVLAVLIPLAALGVYLPLGSPNLEGSPAIFSNLDEMWTRQQALLARHPLQILVEKNPNDIGALVQLAAISRRLGAYPDAIKLYQRTVREAQKSNDMMLRLFAVALGETQVEAKKGIVGDDAIGTFQYVRTLYPGSPIARYYLALAKDQHGDTETAIAEWEELLSDTSPRAYWKEQVRNSLVDARKRAREKKPEKK